MAAGNMKDMVRIANELLTRFGAIGCIKDIKECNQEYFVRIFENMMGEKLPGLKIPTASMEEEIHNMQVVIDCLAVDVVDVDLTHISAMGIVKGEEIHITNLLEIFDGLLEFVLEEFQKTDLEEQIVNKKDDTENQEQESDPDDSNLISHDHEVLSDVFQEEFGTSLKQNRAKSETSKLIQGPNTLDKPEGLGSTRCPGHLRVSSGEPVDLYLWSSSSTGSTEELVREAEDLEKRTTKESGAVVHDMESIPNKVAGDQTQSKGSNGRNQRYETTKLDETQQTQFSVDSLTCSKHGNNSTNELIREAILWEKENKARNANYENTETGLTKTTKKCNVNKLERPYVNEDSSQWSSILRQTSSAVESMADINEIGKRPRREIGTERKIREGKAKTVSDNSSSVQMHKHTHHHYYIHDKDSLASSTSGSTRSTPTSFPDVSEPPAGPNQVQEESPLISQSAQTSVEIQTNTPTVIDTAVQTEPSNRNRRKGLFKDAKQRGIRPSKESFGTTKEDLILDVSSKSSPSTSDESSSSTLTRNLHLQNITQAPDVGEQGTRSEQLANLQARLKKLRGNKDLSKGSLRGAEETNDTRSTRLKEKSRVSFAVRDLENVRAVSFSDSEIDYSSPGPCRPRKGYLVASRKPSPLKGILRNRQTREILSSDDDDINTSVIAMDIPSQSLRYEIPLLKRDERLMDIRRAAKEEEKENKEGIHKLRSKYNKQYSDYHNVKENLKKQSNMQLKGFKKTKRSEYGATPLSKKLVSDKTDNAAKRLTAIYSGRVRKDMKPRKRSASTSPVRRRSRKLPLVVNEDEILPIMEEEFPHIYLSPHTAKMIWQKQMRQVGHLSKVGRSYRNSSTKTKQRFDEAQKKQELLTRIMKKELAHSERLKNYRDMKQKETEVKRKLKERRQNAARARKYYADFHIQHRARMSKKRSKEERIFKQLFEDGLEIQKERLRDIRAYAKEKREKNEAKQENELLSLENYYRDQFEMLAESVARERYEIDLREKAQAQALRKMRCEMRKRMEKDIREIQDQLANDDDAYHFRQVDADNLKREFGLATYMASKK